MKWCANMTNELKIVKQLINDYINHNNPKMKWMWGEGLLGYAMLMLDNHLGVNDSQAFLTQYCDYYLKNRPLLDHADRIAPVLITYLMDYINKTNKYQDLTLEGIDYILHEPRLIGDAVNHLGRSKAGKFYPKSIWVDSLVMFGLLPAIYGRLEGREDILEIVSRQPHQYAEYLCDQDSKLWYHSYWVKSKKPYPQRNLFWGRGNGWVLVALPTILDYLGDHPERERIISIFQETAEAVLKTQTTNGMFKTLLLKPSYEETSATALIAAGFIHGVNHHYLDERFLEPGIRAFNAALTMIKEKQGKLVLTGISGPTIPLQLLPKLGYTIIKRGDNWSYGIAALIFAAIAHDKIGKERKIPWLE